MTGATSSMAQASVTHMIRTSSRLSQPSAGPEAMRRVIRPGSRRAAGPGSRRDTATRIRRARAEGPGRAWRPPRPRGRSGGGSNADGSSVTTTQPTPRARNAASARTQPGSSEAVMMTAVIPRLQPPDRRHQRLEERRRTVGVHGREQLHDLQVLAAAAVGGDVRDARRVDGGADGPVLADRLMGDGGGRLDGDLGRRVLAAADLDRALEVEDRARRRRSARARTP